MNVKLIHRATALLLCVAMLAGFAPVLLPGVVTQINAVENNKAANLMVNGDFEASATELTGWTPISGVKKLSIATDISGNTTNVLKAEQAADSGNMAVMSSVFAVEAGKEYEVSFSILHDITVNDKNQFTAFVFWYGEGVDVTASNYGTTYLGDPSKVVIPTPSGNWEEAKAVVTAPKGATKAMIRFTINNKHAQLGYIDNVSVTEGAVSEPTNHVYTQSFESIKDSGWTASNNFSGVAVNVYPGYYESSTSLFFQAKNTWAKSPEFEIEAGVSYALTFVTQRHNGDSPAGYGRLVFVDTYGREIGDTDEGIGKGSLFSGNKQGNWFAEALWATAPAGAVKAFVEFGREATGGGNYGIDNIAVFKSDEPVVPEVLPTDPTTPTTPGTPSGPSVPAGPATNLLNGSFEEDLAGWKGGSQAGATHAFVTDGAYSGKSILFTANATDTEKAINTVTQTLQIGQIKAYKLSVMSKRLTGENTGYIGLWFYDANGNLLPDSNTAYSINIARTTDWREDALIQAVPAGATTVVLKLGNHSAMKGLSYMVDNVKLEEYTGPADAIQPATPGGNGSGGGVIHEVIDFSQLNTSFEELTASGAPKYWRLPGDKSLWSIKTPADAPFGKNVLEFSTAGKGGTVRTNPVKAEPGVTYEVRLMAKDIVGGGARIGIYMFDADGKRLDDYCVVVPTDGSGKWKIYTAVGVAPENVATIEAWIWYSTQVEATVQIDGLQMRESDVVVKPDYVPDPYTPPTTEELLANLRTEYPRVFFDGKEGAKEVKLRRFNYLKTRYGFSWNEQYNSLLDTAEIYLNETQVRVSMNTGKWVMMDIYPVLKDPSDLDYRQMFLENSVDENGKLFDKPYTGFGALFTEPLADRMRVLSLAYIMTGKAMYAERAISYAMQVADWKVWGDEYWLQQKNLVAEASTGWMMAGMVAVYDMCHDQMTEEQRAKLERNIIEQGLKPLSEAAKPMSLVNGHLMQLGGLLSGCAAVMNEDNIDEIKPYLDVALGWAHNALSNFAYSGNTEGHYYTDFGLETFVPGLGHLYRVTGLEELIDHPFLSEILPYWTVMWAEGAHGTHPNYSDGSVGTYMKLPMAVLSKLTSNPIIDGFLISAGGTGDVFENIVYLNPDPKPAYLTDYVGIVDVIGYGVLRTGFATDSMMLTLKANDSQMGHNHYDQNSIQLNVGGNWLMKDPGAGSYYSGDRSFWTKSGHSTIMVDDNSQMVMGTASIKKVFSNELYGYIIGSAAQTYGSDYDSDILTKFDRHAIQVNHADKGYYMIIDDLASSKEHVYTWHMYNGTRGTFAVDGEEVPERGTAQGNSVSVALGRDVLNLKFVDSDKLAIQDYAHLASGSLAGYGIAASSAATKAHQFMTLISTDSNPNVNFIDFVQILNNRHFTVPEYFEEGDLNWSSSMPLGQESVKMVATAGVTAVFFRGNKVGDWISYPITIEEDGTYDVSLQMVITDGACQIKAYLDDYESEVMDCSGLPVTTEELPFGELELTAGVHTLKIEVVGPGLDEDYEPGWYLIDAVGLNVERLGVETPPAKDLYVAETYDTEEVLGALVNYVDNKYDLLTFNRTAGGITVDKLITDAKQASVLGLVDGVITEGFAATGATAMSYDGKTLFNADKKVDVVASNTGWQVIATEAGTITLSAVAPERDYVITVNGEAVDAKIADGALTIALAAGENHIAVAEEAPVEDPTDPTQGTEATDPTDPGATEPNPGKQDGNNATLWIILAVVAVLAIGAAVAIVIIKKRKAA